MLPVWLSVVLAGSGGCTSEGRQQVTLHDSRGTEVGTVTVEPSTIAGVSFAFDLRGLPPGEHAVHLHQTPTCDGPSFESAGPHLNPTQKQHGLENPLGPHDGDMSDLTVAADGTAKGTIDNARVTLVRERVRSVPSAVRLSSCTRSPTT